MADETDLCKGCGVSVRIREEDIERMVAAFLLDHRGVRATDSECARRLAVCRACDELEYGTTCRHCGCIVQVMARISDKHCPRPGASAW